MAFDQASDLLLVCLITDTYLQKFSIYHANVHGTEKMKEYNYTSVSRVKAFLYYMSFNQQRVWDWKFFL